MDQIRTILVAVDFSLCSSDALRQAVRIGGWKKSSVRAMHVLTIPAIIPVPPAMFPWPMPSQEDLAADAMRRWEGFAQGCEGKDKVRFEIFAGSPREEILRQATDQKADLLVLGAHSVRDAKRGIGTVAAACVRRAETKVLLVQPGAVGPFRCVVVCVDFSETSRLAVEQAVRVAANDDAALHIVHVYHDPWWGMNPPVEVMENMPDFEAQLRRGVESRLRSFCEPLEHEINALKGTFHGIKHDENWAGNGEGLIRFFRSKGADLAVLGVRSNWNVRDFLMGSTAERVVRDASCCVLTVRPPATA